MVTLIGLLSCLSSASQLPLRCVFLPVSRVLPLIRDLEVEFFFIDFGEKNIFFKFRKSWILRKKNFCFEILKIKFFSVPVSNVVQLVSFGNVALYVPYFLRFVFSEVVPLFHPQENQKSKGGFSPSNYLVGRLNCFIACRSLFYRS